MTVSTEIEKYAVSRHEWRWAILWAVILMTVSCLPYLLILWHTPVGWHFAGGLILPNDVQTYLAKMGQGAAGYWTFHVSYTPEPHGRFYIYLFYLALGHLARLLSCPPIVMFHLARVIGGFGLLLIIFRFLSHVLPNSTERWIAFILISTSSGLGWLGVIFGALPIDLWIVDGFTPYMLYSQPHLIVAMILMLQLWHYLLFPPIQTITGRLSLMGIITIVILTLVLALTLPFATISLNLLAIMFFITQSVKNQRFAWLEGQLCLIILLASLPYMVYLLQLSQTNPIIIGWNLQNGNPAPPVLDFVLGYALLGLWATVGVITWARQAQPNRVETFIVVTAITLIIAIYAPIAFQRRFILGLHVLLGILATWGLKRAVSRRYQSLAVNLTLVMGIIASLVVWLMPLAAAWPSPNQSEYAQNFYIRDEELTALAWLKAHTTEQQVILASPHLGMFIPVYTHANTFYGHSAETLNSIQRRQMSKDFFMGQLPQIPPEVDFIIYGPSERALGHPDILKELPLVFETKTVQIYQVLK